MKSIEEVSNALYKSAIGLHGKEPSVSAQIFFLKNKGNYILSAALFSLRCSIYSASSSFCFSRFSSSACSCAVTRFCCAKSSSFSEMEGFSSTFVGSVALAVVFVSFVLFSVTLTLGSSTGFGYGAAGGGVLAFLTLGSFSRTPKVTRSTAFHKNVPTKALSV